MSIERDKYGFDAPAALGHPARSSLPDGHSTGPVIGERLPDFTLPNAYGELVNYHESRGKAKSAVVFFRSAVW